MATASQERSASPILLVPETEFVGPTEAQNAQLKALAALSPKIGASWFKVLEEEFSKPYFATLSDFVVEERRKGSVLPSPEEVWT